MSPKTKPLILGVDEAHKKMRWIYISPHFDDAVLSAGGLIWEQAHSGISVEIWTICAGDPPGPDSEFADRLHRQWGTGSGMDTVTFRRTEDRNAARRVGATTRHFSIPDAIYRRSQTGDPFYPVDIFDPIHPEDTGVIDQVVELLESQINNYDTLVCPLAVGGHVDHVITRAAVEKLGRSLWYYADIPYFLRYPEQLQGATKKMAPKTFFVSSRGLTAWQGGIAAYASQLSSLFDDEFDMRHKIRDYLRVNSGLRLWEME